MKTCTIHLMIVFLTLPSLYGGTFFPKDISPYDARRAESYLKAASIQDIQALLSLGWLYYDLLDYDAAQEVFTTVSSDTVRADSLMQGRAYLALSLIHLRQSEPKGSASKLKEALKILPWPRGPSEMAFIKLVEAETAFFEERQVRGVTVATEALTIVEFSNNSRLKKMILLLLGGKGPTGNREEFLLRALNVDFPGGTFQDVSCRILLASLRSALGKNEQALSILIPVSEKLVEGLSDRLVFAARREEGLIRKAMGRNAGAIRSLVLARNSALRLGDLYGFSQTTIPLSDCCKAKNMAKKGIEYLHEAVSKLREKLNDSSLSSEEKKPYEKLLEKLNAQTVLMNEAVASQAE